MTRASLRKSEKLSDVEEDRSSSSPGTCRDNEDVHSQGSHIAHTMSKALSSPTARILRSSRFFALPAPLPQPSVDIQVASGRIKTSDTATLPYPTQQAITAPASSRLRGDWGMKRPLPALTNRTSTPVVRLNAMDTFEHITDFDSASEHTLTLKKAQDMNLWMAHSTTKQEGAKLLVSAFDDDLDRTSIREHTAGGNEVDINTLPLGVQRALRVRSINRHLKQSGEQLLRWKTKGPFLPGLSETEFEKYLVDVVSRPKIRQEFQQYLVAVREDKKRMQIQDQLREESGFNPEDPADVARLNEMIQEDQEDSSIDHFMLQLRDNNDNLSSELSGLIQEFFDLPPLPKPNVRATSIALDPRATTLERPPKTHPSSGLTYSHTNAFIENSPVHGPQYEKTPMHARLLRPRSSANGSAERALIGVGGFVVTDNHAKSYRSNDTTTNESQGMQWDFETPGGNKLWVTPTHASINDAGRIVLRVDDANKEAIAVKTKGIDPRTLPSYETEHFKYSQVGDDAQHRNNPTPGTPQNANFGGALPNLGVRTVRPAQPFKGEDLDVLKQALKHATQGNSKNRVSSSSMVDMLGKRRRS